MSIVVCFALGALALSAFCTCRPKHIESVTTAKASAVVFMVLLFSFGIGSAEQAYSLIEKGIQEARKGNCVNNLQVRKATGASRLPDLRGTRIDRLALVESRSIKN